ncbi:efflux RND transporter permease subunit [Kushneria indalinina]|uniref:Multidrug efflux pump n=1 Tax=Kushneria indalinina DSM 14324 TaxID=1122140 RepID=A0A3D9DYB2_9GAMM|nr:efflux RND transporter permease subunit [Kushneria indalinina]REC95254.1 multidrug efflux pump [Kushneria indalinina DSM 14324]
MTLTDLAVTRPVGTLVLSALLVLFGTLGFLELPIREYPSIEEPEVSVEIVWPGASAAVVESRVTQTIENVVAGIEGVVSVESESNDGESEVTLTFASDIDLDTAANDVRDQVSRVADALPVGAEAPEISKDQGGSDTLMILSVQTDRMSAMALSDYADRQLLDRFSTIAGVSRVRLWGSQLPAMRVDLDRHAMTAHDITVEDITGALASENVEYPGGRIESTTREFTVRLLPGYETPESFRRLPLRRGEGTRTVTLGDVATVSLGPETRRESFQIDGEPTVSIAISRQSTANTLSIARGVRATLDTLQDELPEGMRIDIVSDDTLYISAALREVLITLAIAVAMVVAVIIFFLGSWRAALVAATAIPISLLACGMILLGLGFSLNMLTLLALVLSVGLVVDDAIVMIENIQRHLEEGDAPLVAAFRGARQVAFAIIATSLVLMAVFLPITLMSGQTGRLFTEFAVTIAATIAFSTLVSLTLTPVMASWLLAGTRSRQGSPAGRLMAGVARRYQRHLGRMLHRPVLVSGGFVAMAIVTATVITTLPTEYEPYDDRGALRIGIQAEEGVNFEEMHRRMTAMGQHLAPILGDKALIDNASLRLPAPGNSEGAVNNGRWIISFTPWQDRDESTREVAARINEALEGFSELSATTMLPRGLSSGNTTPVQFVVGGPDYATLGAWRDQLMAAWQDYPGLEALDSDLIETTPQLQVRLDRERAAQLGVSAETVGRTLESFFGERSLTTFERDGQSYDVILQGLREQRLTPEALEEIRVRTDSGTLVSLANLVHLEEIAVSPTLNRYNRIRAVTFSANVADGYSLSQVLDHMNDTVAQTLPERARIDYKGATQDFLEAGRDLLLVFTVAIAVTWLVLAAQFENFISPLVVMLTVPLGMLGAGMALWLLGESLNLYAQIGLLMLIGLSAKNGILIVEFANQLRDEGVALREAILQAAQTRLRPILMTSLSTMAGALPLVMATGAGAASRFGLGITLLAGCASATLLTLGVVPIAYYWLAGHQKPPGHRRQQLRASLERHTPEAPPGD